jgi:multiple sugar transport system substrate-binding protein
VAPGGSVREAVDWAVAEFQKENPAYTVKVIHTPGKDYYKKSLTMLAGKARVDVLWLGQGFGMFAGRNALYDLDPLAAQDASFPLSDYIPEVLTWYQRDGRQYGIPYGVQVLLIAYNLDLFEKEGIAPPHSEWTLEEMLDKARRLTRFRPGSRILEVAGLGIDSLDYRYYGLSLLRPEGGGFRFNLNTELGRQWLHRNVELLEKDRVLQRGADFESMDSLNGFLNQRVAMIPAASWDIPELRKRAHFRWDVAPIPTGFQGSRFVWASSSGFSIARSSPQPEIAWKLLKKLTGADFQRKLLEIQIPTLKSVQAEYLSANPAPPAHLDEALRMLDFMQPNPRISSLAEVEAEWKYWQDLVLLRKISVEEALSKAESHINRILKLNGEDVVE